MNPLKPKRLLLTKWTVAAPVAEQKHLLISRAIEPDVTYPLAAYQSKGRKSRSEFLRHHAKQL